MPIKSSLTQQLEPVIDELDECSRALMNSTQRQYEVASSIEDRFLGENQDVSLVCEAVARLTDEVAQLLVDFDLVANDRALSRLVVETALPPIQEEAQGFSVVVLQSASMRVSSVGDGVRACRQGNLLILCPIRVIMNGSVRGEYLLSIEVACRITAAGKLSLQLFCAPRLLANNRWVDVFSDVPLDKGLREQVRSRIIKDISSTVAKMEVEPELPPQISLRPMPKYVLARRVSSLNLVGCAHPRYRERHALIDDPDTSFSEAVRLKREYFSSELTNRIASMGVRVEGIHFKNNSIELRTRKDVEEDKCWVKVSVQVWSVFSVSIQEDLRNVWFIEAAMTQYAYKIRAKNCWPKCGDVLDEARRRTLEEISKYYLNTFSLFDLNSVAQRSKVRTTPYGLIVSLERW